MIVKSLDVEIKRKLVHFLVVLALWLIFKLISFDFVLFLSALLFFGVFLSELAIRGYNVPVIKWGIVNFDRPEDVVFRPGLGVFTLLTGMLLTAYLGFLLKIPKKFVELALVLPAADTFSTVFGLIFGKHRWKHSKKKSLEGSAFFFFVAFAICLLYKLNSRKALALALLTTFVESLPNTDDNLNISLATLVFAKIFL